MRMLVLFCVGLSFVAALLAVFCLNVPVEVVVTWGMGALCLSWLALLVTLPWNLYFDARHVLDEIAESRRRGLLVAQEREAYAGRVARRMVRACVGAHVLSAAVVATITYVRGGHLGYYFASFYLVGTFIRPGFEYYQHVKERLGQILEQTRYPREDVLALQASVGRLEVDRARIEHEVGDLRAELDRRSGRSDARQSELDHRLVALGRKFEETLDLLTDNQEIIAGVKAFLRLVRQEG